MTELTIAQHHINNNPSECLYWCQVKGLGNQLEKYLIDQQINWMQQASQTWL